MEQCNRVQNKTVGSLDLISCTLMYVNILSCIKWFHVIFSLHLVALLGVQSDKVKNFILIPTELGYLFDSSSEAKLLNFIAI